MGNSCCTGEDKSAAGLDSASAGQTNDFVVKRSASRLITSQELADKLASVAQSSGNLKDSGGKAGINLELLEAMNKIVEEDSSLQCEGIAKENNVFLTEDHLLKVESLANSENALRLSQKGSTGSTPTATMKAPPMRKDDSMFTNAGLITKEELVDLLDNASDDEDKGISPAVPGAITGADVHARVKQRKGTGAVSKNKIQKILQRKG